MLETDITQVILEPNRANCPTEEGRTDIEGDGEGEGGNGWEGRKRGREREREREAGEGGRSIDF